MKKFLLFLVMSFCYVGACDERARIENMAKSYFACLASHDASEQVITCYDLENQFGSVTTWTHNKFNNVYSYMHVDYNNPAGYLLSAYPRQVATKRESSQAEFDFMKKVAQSDRFKEFAEILKSGFGTSG